MELLYSSPYLITETAEPPGFPQTVDFTIGGRSYVGNTSFEPYRRDAFRHRSIQAQRESIDLDNIPGEGTVNTEGLWRRGADDWHFGAGQPYQDRKDTQAARFSTSKGINPWMQWQAELLNDTTQLLGISGNAQVLAVGEYLWVLYTLAGTPTINVYGLNGLVVQTSFTGAVMMATDGSLVYIATNMGGGGNGIYTLPAAANAGATQLVTSGNFDGVWYVGDRLMITFESNVYNVVSASPASPPSPLWTHWDAYWHWSSMCAGSSQIYMTGYSNATTIPCNSVVYRTTIEATGTALTIPVQALPMEGGEYCTSLYGYLNYVFVGSNLGVRMCRTIAAYDPTGNEGDLEAGPLLPGLFPPGPVSSPVQAMVGNNRFMYFGWSNYDGVSTGVGRLDLSTFIDTQAPAFTSDLMVTGSGLVTSMDWNPINNALIFVVEGMGVYTDSGYPVQSGTITSGQIEYGIPDDKILWAGDIGTVQPQQGTVTMSVAVDGAAQTLVGTQNSSANGGATNQSAFPIGQIRGDLTIVQMTLTKDAVTGESPILHRWTLKALPAITAGTTISAVVLLYETVSQRGADQYYDPYAEYSYLYNLRTTQNVVQYQEASFSAMCVIDELDWLPFKQNDANTEGGFLGDIIVYLKTVDVNS